MAKSRPGKTDKRPVGRWPKGHGCVVKKCPRPMQYQKHGLCRPHYMRWYRTGDVGGTSFRALKRRATYQGE